MLEFVNGKLWTKLENLGEDAVAERFRRVFTSVRNHSRRGASFARVVQQVNRIDFGDETDVIALSEIYESLRKRVAADSAGYAGEFYTQRHIIRAMVEVVRPQIGEKVYDPCFGTAGFTARDSGKSLTQRFVLNLPLIGAPENRENKLLLAMLSNRERLIRYLLMLLAGPEFALRDLQQSGTGGKWKNAHFAGGFGLPLLEPLLRTLSDDPARLADVERLVRDLESSDEGAALLPEEFAQVWSAIRSVRRAILKEANDVVS
ncbi:MAG: N-6 DNA methylase [Planctomycetota bacterium]|nr:MAG: N-6 DNA methylase [Planctomycetota bacterium]